MIRLIPFISLILSLGALFLSFYQTSIIVYILILVSLTLSIIFFIKEKQKVFFIKVLPFLLSLITFFIILFEDINFGKKKKIIEQEMNKQENLSEIEEEIKSTEDSMITFDYIKNRLDSIY